MKVNEEAEGVLALRARVARLECALRPFLTGSRGYTSTVSRGERICMPRVTQTEMEYARKALNATS